MGSDDAATVGEICAGYGGLHLGLAKAGCRADLAWYAEIDPDASTVLAAAYPGAPNHGDITAVDWSHVQPVDIITAGYPCQDLSNAGKRAGIEGARSGIWRNVADAIRVLRPRLVLLENVRAHLARGFGRVLGDLAVLGYDAAWTCLRASDVGAPHQRDRVFILATPAAADRSWLRFEPVPVAARGGATGAGGDREDADLTLLPTPTSTLGRGSGLPTSDLAAARRGAGRRFLDDAVALLPTPAARDSGRGSGYTDEAGRPLSETVMRLLPTPYAGDAKGTRNATAGRTKTRAEGRTNHDGWTLSDIAYADRWAQYGPAIRRWEAVTGRPAPEPTITGKRGGQRLSGRFVEWMMGLPAGRVTDHVDNSAAVRVCGNGVVPAQVAAAWSSLVAA